ncbi:MAG TPA: GlxA family transcriptional regulator [Woeseiaceae bacterium]|nr:GlxA family transcriptional regulator [Woeseiaceae bacterium]
MFETAPDQLPQKIAFLLLPDFSMMAFTSSVEPLRAANRLSGKTLYSWRTLSIDGNPVQASNGIVIVPDGSIHDELDAKTLFVCAGIRAERFGDKTVFGRLREFSRRGVALGGVCTGSLALARAGLLDGYRCTIHWENMEGFVEDFPKLQITATLFEIDRDRYTCSGGTAPLDMMIYSISRDFSDKLAIGVAEQMLHSFVRQPHDAQRMSIQYRTGISNPKLLAVIAYMEAYLESPVTLAELANSVKLSVRQLERLFRQHLGKTPTRYYLELRLQRAQLLLRQTSMPILQVAVASGFASASHFARCYREFFECAPRAERAQYEAAKHGEQAEREAVYATARYAE